MITLVDSSQRLIIDTSKERLRALGQALALFFDSQVWDDLTEDQRDFLRSLFVVVRHG